MFSYRKHTEVFFGWWIVGAAFFIALYVGGAIHYGFTAIFEPIANEMGWSYTQVSLAASLRGLEMGLLAPLIGIATDRWGPRRLIFGGAFIITAGLILLSRTTSLAMFYAAFALIGVGTSFCTMTVLMTAVANWFRRKMGMASGIAMSGFGASGLLVPVIVKLIDLYDWRRAITILALGMLGIVLPLSLLFRHRPEQYGYLPDGQAERLVTPASGPSLSPDVEVEVKAKQALRSRIFWGIALAFIYHSLVAPAVVTHVMPYLSSIGVARSRASLVATAFPLLSIGGRLGLGGLGDRTDRRWVTAGAFVMIGLGIFCFAYAASAGTWLLVPFVILFGFGYGGSNAMRAPLVREYFGRTNFGTVFGLTIGISMLGQITGPALAGWVYDTWGSYQGIWFILAGLAVIAIISILTIPQVRSVASNAKPSLK